MYLIVYPFLFPSLVYGGTIIPSEDRNVVIEEGDEESFSWTLTPGTNERVVNLFLYNGTESKENELWGFIDILEKGEEMFNGRLEVKYDDQKDITVTIKDAMLNDSITILVTGTFLNNADIKLSESFESSVTLDVKGKLYYFK